MSELEEYKKEEIEKIVERHQDMTFDVIFSLALELQKLLNKDFEWLVEKNEDDVTKLFKSLHTEIDFVVDELEPNDNNPTTTNLDEDDEWDTYSPYYDPYLEGWRKDRDTWANLSSLTISTKKLGGKRIFTGGKEEK